LDTPAITEEDRKLVDNFHHALNQMKLEECKNCGERWFDMSLNGDGVCKRCRQKGKANLFTKQNNLDPGESIQELARKLGLPIPEPLSQVEEILISPVQVMMQAFNVRGGQHKYSGHCCNFIKDTTNLVNKLPRLPEELDIIIVRPKSNDSTAADLVSRQIKDAFRVKRARVVSNLQILQLYHPAFKQDSNFELDLNALNSLPEDGSVYDRLRTITHDSVSSGVNGMEGPNAACDDPDESDLNIGMISNGFVPSTNPKEREIMQIQQQLQPVDVTLTQPRVHSRAINEHDPNIKYIINAFPTLFPQGCADLHDRRPHGKVSPEQYFRHLLRWKDGRFATHPRFRYFALNSVMRWCAKTEARCFTSRNRQEGGMRVRKSFLYAFLIETGDLRELLHGDLNNLALRVSRLGANLRGTRPYWLTRRRDLRAMIKQLCCPHLFATFSAADVQWPDLHRFMPTDLPPNCTEQERARIYNRDLNDNPGIAAYYFHRRWELFLHHVLKPKFNIVDFWYRYEWQHRGSSHVHAFFWLKDAPKVEDLDLENAESIQQFIQFWDPLVSTMNPSINEPVSMIHPSAQHPSTLSYTHRELAQLLNRVQRHTRCTSYCLRRPKGAPKEAELVCRFKYPKDIRELSEVIKDERGLLQFVTKRNDSVLNEYNTVQILGWRANVDFTPCVSRGAVEAYISKYCSKTEVKSESYGELFNTVLPKLEEDVAGTIAFQKLLGELIIERDWTAQECMHILLGCPMYRSSRQFRSLNVSNRRSNPVLNHDQMEDEDSSAVASTLLDRYESRPPGVLNDIPLFRVFQRYRWEKGEFKFCPRTTYVVNVWPAYVPDQSDPEMYENWCRAKLQLHHPYRNLNDLQKDEDGNDIGWIAAYEKCRAECDEHDPDPLMTLEEMEVDHDIESEFEEEEEEEDPVLRDWQVLAGQGPRNRPTDHRLGSRDIDTQFDWQASYRMYDSEDVKTGEMYLEEQKRQTEHITDDIPDVDISKLTDNQRRIWVKVFSHYSRTLLHQNPPPLRINIDGTAGTGKSFLISAITKTLNSFAAERGLGSPIIRVAPTGIAAFNINGSTLHETFSIPTKCFSKLNNAQELQLQKRLKDCKYIILDEKSMVGRRMLGYLDNRLRVAFPEKSNEMFGGCSLLMFGDFGQLPPVGDTALFNLTHYDESSNKNIDSNYGRSVYMNGINESITLNRVMRQQGDSPTAIRFREVLSCVQSKEATEADCEFLNTRCIQNLSPEERSKFLDDGDTLYLCPRNAQVSQINDSKMAASGNPVVVIPARHTGRGASKASDDEAEGLVPKLKLMEGAKVMLTRNIWTKQGLTNGSTGTIRIALRQIETNMSDKIIFTPEQTPHRDVPAVIMVKMPCYKGPTLWYAEDGTPIVPLVPFTVRWHQKNGIPCSRTQYPLRIAYAVTIHKSQGMTLNKAIVEPGDRDDSRGQLFVALSRVRRVEDLALRSLIDVERVNKGAPSGRDYLQEDNIRRAHMGFTDPDDAEEFEVWFR